MRFHFRVRVADFRASPPLAQDAQRAAAELECISRQGQCADSANTLIRATRRRRVCGPQSCSGRRTNRRVRLCDIRLKRGRRTSVWLGRQGHGAILGCSGGHLRVAQRVSRRGLPEIGETMHRFGVILQRQHTGLILQWHAILRAHATAVVGMNPRAPQPTVSADRVGDNICLRLGLNEPCQHEHCKHCGRSHQRLASFGLLDCLEQMPAWSTCCYC